LNKGIKPCSAWVGELYARERVRLELHISYSHKGGRGNATDKTTRYGQNLIGHIGSMITLGLDLVERH
jgi:hypothetical protein